MKSKISAGLIASVMWMICILPTFANAQEWAKDMWNPQSDENDIVLPLPCGGAMAFRKVVTAVDVTQSAADRLRDKRVILGRSGSQQGFIDFARAENLAGPFLDDAGKRYFLIAKYETTQAQFDAVLDNCDAAQNADEAVPAVEVSWYEAIEFTRKLNTFWYEKAFDSLPMAETIPGFARLPSESEWEFASRGGLAVGEAEFQADRFPMAQGSPLHEYIMYGDSASSGGEIALIGSVKSNPLGIYDSLGNVAEMVLEPFRLNRAGRLHGQRGGFIVKGGSFTSEVSDATNAARVEYPYFNGDLRSEQRSRDVGFRIIISAEALGNLSTVNQLQQAWQEAAASRLPEELDPAQAIDALAKSTTDLSVKSDLERIKGLIVATSASRNEAEDRLVRTVLQSSGHLQRTICESGTKGRRLKMLIAHYGSRLDDPDAAKKHKRSIKRMREVDSDMIQNVELYTDQVVRLTNDFDPVELEREKKLTVAELRNRNRSILAAYVNGFYKTLTLIRDSGRLEPENVRAILLPDSNTSDVCPRRRN